MDWQTNDRLRTLLGPKPTHPWGALIPQLLLWSFRRFCVEKLLYCLDQPLSEQVWDDHLELVNRYCPHGLESVCATWLTEDNLALVHSSLEEYNAFFLDFVKVIDAALESDSEEEQAHVSEFLDETVRKLCREWVLGGTMEKFFIFPMEEDKDDIFTAEQMLQLIDNLIEYSRDRADKILEKEPVALPSAPLPPPPEEPEQEAHAPAAPAAVPTPIEPLSQVAEAMRRRRITFRAHGHRANRNRTLRHSRARAKTRKNHIDTQ
jgi:hypothetical protein